MPTIPKLQEENNAYPEAPAATDISPQRFGRDAAALSQLGGQIGEFGEKLVRTRKAAIDSDAVANAKTEDTIALDKQVDEIRKTWDPNSPDSPAEGLRASMNKTMEARLKQMPSGEAQRAYRDRMAATMESKYLETLKWENHSRAAIQNENLLVRADKASSEIFNAPSMRSTLEHLNDLNADIQSKAGVSLEVADAPKVYNKLGSNIAKSYFSGLAESSVEMTPERRAETIKLGREMLKKPPKEIAPLLSGEDIRVLEGRFDQAEREGKINDNYMDGLNKKAIQEARDKEQNKLLEDIYEGKGSVKSILRSNLDPDKKQVMLNVLKAKLNEPKIPRQDALHNVFERIHADDEDPKKIRSEDQLLKEFTSGKLTVTQLKQARTELNSLGTVHGQVEGDLKKQLMRQAESVLVKKGPMGIADPDAQANLAKFNSYVIGEIEAQRKAGKPVRELLDANSPNYLGKAIQNYQKTPQQVMKSTLERVKQKTQAVQAVKPPPDTVRMLDPSGKPGFIPKGNVDKALKRGFKVAPVSSRKPSSIGEPVLKEEVFGLSFDDESIERLLRDPKLSNDDKIVRLEEFREELRDYEGDDPDVGPEKYDALVKRVSNLQDELIAEEQMTPEEEKVVEKNKKYTASLDKGPAKETKPASPEEMGPINPNKNKELKTRKGTKAELEAIRKSKSGSLKVD